MEIDTYKSIEVLNTLIEINNDRIEGYETAINETTDAVLKDLFTVLIHTSRKCKDELVTEVQSLGGTSEEGTKNTGKFFRVWMEVKAALTGNDKLAILNSCEYGEDVAVNTYRKVLKNNLDDLSSQEHALVSAQYLLLMADHDRIKFLRDQLADKN